MYNKGDLLLNEAVMRRLRQHMNPQKVLQIAGVVDVHDSELTKKIQQQLMSQYDIGVLNGAIADDGRDHIETGDMIGKDLQRLQLIGSLLA
jgi:hypothetical protein